MKNYSKNKEGGYAILFTVVIIGVILAIATGMSDVAYKELVLSSVASDSQTAFYQADTAAECGLYADAVVTLPVLLSNTFSCGKDSSGSAIQLSLTQPDPAQALYDLSPSPKPKGVSPCFDVNFDQTGALITGKNLISAKGYNMCDKANTRTVERLIQVSY